MGKPSAPTPTSSKPTKGRNGNKPFENKVKLDAIEKVHGGQSKAAVARLIGVPESTLRGWCKNEQKIRNQVQQENQALQSDASNSSSGSSSSPAGPSLLMQSSSAAVGVGGTMGFSSNAPQPFNSAPPKTLYTPLEIDILKDPKTPQNLPLRAEIPRSNGRNKAELHRIGMGMPLYDPFTSHQSPRGLLQDLPLLTTGSSKKSSQASAATPGTSDIVGLAMAQLLMQYNQQQQSLQQHQTKMQKINDRRFSTCGLQSTSNRPSSRGNKRMSAASTSSSSPLNRALTPEMLQLLSPFPVHGHQTSTNEQELLRLAFQLATTSTAQTQAQAPDRVQPAPVNNGRPRIPGSSSVPIHQFGDKYWMNLMNMSSRPSSKSQFIPEQNVPQSSPQNVSQGSPQIVWKGTQQNCTLGFEQDYPQDLRKSSPFGSRKSSPFGSRKSSPRGSRKSTPRGSRKSTPRGSRSPASSVSSRHHDSDFSSPGTPQPFNNQRDSNGSSPYRASPAPERYSPSILNQSAATSATTSPGVVATATGQPEPDTVVAVPEKSPPIPPSRRLEAVLAGVFKKNRIDIARFNQNITDCDEVFKTHLGEPIYEIEHREDGLLVGKMFYNFLNKFESNPAITATFLGQVKHAIHAISVKDQVDTPMDQSE